MLIVKYLYMDRLWFSINTICSYFLLANIFILLYIITICGMVGFIINFKVVFFLTIQSLTVF